MARGLSQRLVVSEQQVGRTLVAFMALGFGALLAAAIAIGWITERGQTFSDSVIRTQRVRQAIGDLQISLEQSETARRGLLLADQPVFREAYARTTGELVPALRRIAAMTADNPRQQRRAATIAEQLRRLQPLRARTIALIERGADAAALAEFRADASVSVTRSIRYRLRAMAAEEMALLAIRDARQAQATRWFYAMLAVTGVLLVVVTILAVVVVLRSTRAIAASRDRVRDLADSLEDQVAERTADLSRANEEIQRFAYIVSHDLRSPLVNVMGFTAELESAGAALRTLVDRAETEAPQIVDAEARLAAREDLPEAIGFIRTSTQKMDRLITAILTLSRQGRRTLTPEAIDLAAMVTAIRGTLAHRLDELGAQVEVAEPLPALVSDRLAIEQVLSNLIENSVKYAQPGRPVRVSVSGRREGARVVLEVADNGRGIDPRDHERVFDLFRRSGAQDQPGEGIGLAHVRALVYRLGGTIGVASTLGNGATFRVSLPHHLIVETA